MLTVATGLPLITFTVHGPLPFGHAVGLAYDTSMHAIPFSHAATSVLQEARVSVRAIATASIEDLQICSYSVLFLETVLWNRV